MVCCSNIVSIPNEVIEDEATSIGDGTSKPSVGACDKNPEGQTLDLNDQHAVKLVSNELRKLRNLRHGNMARMRPSDHQRS
jgi:hypothetical protein